MQKRTLTLVAIGFAIYAPQAFAYVGPGLGAGTIGVVLGFLVSILLAIFALFWYPLKRLFRRFFPVKGGNDGKNQT